MSIYKVMFTLLRQCWNRMWKSNNIRKIGPTNHTGLEDGVGESGHCKEAGCSSETRTLNPPVFSF